MYYEFLTREVKQGVKTKKFEDENFIIYWEGFLFVKGLAPGEESVGRIILELRTKKLKDICELLSGIYACIIFNKKERSFYIFSDNNGISNLFYNQNYISTYFLEAIKINRNTKADIDPIGLVDFILTGSCMQWRTLINGIKKLRYDEIIVYNGNEVKIEKKNLNDIFQINYYDKFIVEEFRPIAESLKRFNQKISMDLTAGRDTRLISLMLKLYNVKFEYASAGFPGDPDLEIPKKIAQLLGIEHYVSYHFVKPNKIEKELDDAFKDFDGLMDIVSWHNYYQFQKDKYNRNCALTITGHAGELYKPYDFMWDVDNKDPIKTIDQLLSLKLFIRYGLGRDDISHTFFTDAYNNYADNYKKNLRSFLIENFGNDNSGKTSPKIYTYYMEGSRTTNMGPLVDRYSPLLERSIIPCGTTLKYPKNTLMTKIRRTIKHPWDDRLSFDHRVLTYLNKKVAKIPTDEYYGPSYSSQTTEQIKDLIKQQIARYKKAYHRPIYRINPHLYPTLKSLNKTQELFDMLKNENILKKNKNPEDISDLYFGSLFTIGKLYEYIEKLN